MSGAGPSAEGRAGGGRGCVRTCPAPCRRADTPPLESAAGGSLAGSRWRKRREDLDFLGEPLSLQSGEKAQFLAGFLGLTGPWCPAFPRSGLRSLSRAPTPRSCGGGGWNSAEDSAEDRERPCGEAQTPGGMQEMRTSGGQLSPSPTPSRPPQRPTAAPCLGLQLVHAWLQLQQS